MNKHCKGQTNEAGICPTCGDEIDGVNNECPIEIYNQATNWRASLIKLFDASLVICLALVAVYGFGKAFGVW